MFHIIFETPKGKLPIGGGEHPLMRCREIAGLGIPQKNYKTVNYVGESGQQTVSEIDMPRAITISGDVIGGQYELTNVIKLLYYEGDLKMQFGNKKRKIHCRCTDLDDPVRHGEVSELVMQFVCDDPEFTDFDPSIIDLFSREDLIKSPFAFPSGGGMIFTRRLNGADIINNGDLNTYPVFKIMNQGVSGTGGGSSEKNGVLIQNATLGQKIELNYASRAGEEIVIDVDERRIESFYNGTVTNLISYLSDDTFLNQFWLATGKNQIAITNFNPESSLSISCAYYNRYIEAVY